MKFSSSTFFSSSIPCFCWLSIEMASLCVSGLSSDKLLIDLSMSAVLFLYFLSIFLYWTILLSYCYSMNSSIAYSFCCWSPSSSSLQSLKIFLISGSKFYKFCSSFLFIREVFFEEGPVLVNILHNLAWLLSLTVRSECLFISSIRLLISVISSSPSAAVSPVTLLSAVGSITRLSAS